MTNNDGLELGKGQIEKCQNMSCPFLQDGICLLAGKVLASGKEWVTVLKEAQVPEKDECIFKPSFDNLTGKEPELMLEQGDDPMANLKGTMYFLPITMRPR
jgi:hypothetical protein